MLQLCRISVWIVILLCIVTANCIYLLTSITIEKINEKLMQAMKLYHKDSAGVQDGTREGWNELQFYVRSQSYELHTIVFTYCVRTTA